jgi:hypothetical protein
VRDWPRAVRKQKLLSVLEHSEEAEQGSLSNSGTEAWVAGTNPTDSRVGCSEVTAQKPAARIMAADLGARERAVPTPPRNEAQLCKRQSKHTVDRLNPQPSVTSPLDQQILSGQSSSLRSGRITTDLLVTRQRPTKHSQEWRAIAHVRPSRSLSAPRDITRCVEPSLVVRARRATLVAGTP